MMCNVDFRRGCWAGCLVLAVAGAGAAAEPLNDDRWRYTTEEPSGDWTAKEFDDSDWWQGTGGFGNPETPGARVGTEWRSSDIWLRRPFSLDEVPERPALLIHHDEDAEVFVNGREVARFEGYTTWYQIAPLDEAGQEALVAGDNLLAVHCHQTDGGQFIDVHVVDRDDLPALPGESGEPFASQLVTRWGEDVTAENAWREYPRPQRERDGWQNLNGPWDYAVTSRESETPDEWAGKILVPYCIESKLSGVARLLQPFEALWYRRTVALDPQPGHRTLLNFEAVDYRCRVWVNGQEVGGHVGGNTPFSIDITDAARAGDNELIVRVEDATGGFQLRGKQTLDPSGIWYTRVSGIWQTVWLEEVPERHIDDLKIATDIDSGEIRVDAELKGPPVDGERLSVAVFDGERRVAEAEGTLRVRLDQPRLWSPDDPHLYGLVVELRDADGEVVDRVESYTGLREVGRERDADGHLRLTLNGEPIFHWGPLDQGWWPDGLLTPPSDEAMRFEIDFLKRAGFNMIRKHIKVEPRRYYYHCDRAGMLVWQDHVSGGENPPWTRLRPDPIDAEWSDEDHAQFMQELEEMIDRLENHPSIVVWVPFNEAWGQHRTVEVGRWVMERDPTRLVNIASGGNFWPVGHIADQHRYPHPGFPLEDDRFDDYVKVVGEFGGHGWPVEGHLWDESKDNWGYGGLPETLDEYKQRYRTSLQMLQELKAQGVAAGVYTQTTDVEGEINGLMTYDRRVMKIPAEELRAMSRPLFER